LSAEADLRGNSVKSQFRRADKSGARLAMVLGAREIEQGVVQVKGLSGDTEQAEVPRPELLEHCRQRLTQESE
ncbi:MAG: His/Gly/Thr/Pro-type tRNA ligase C-terminal domain-containing protein, partial [Sandaracinaceae bacterium]